MKHIRLSDRVAARLNRAQLRPYHPTPRQVALRRVQMQHELRVILASGPRRA